MADIFLSYAREDIKKAEILASALESLGWTIFWDKTSLLAGQDFEAVINQAIQQAGCMIVAWSEASTLSDWVRGEAGIGRGRNILVPILFEQVEPPIAFRSLHTEDLTDWDGGIESPDFLKLCKAINERITLKTVPNTSFTPSNMASNMAIESAKTNFLKRWFGNVWDWLSITKHQQTLAFIGGGLSIVIAGGWQAYQHFYNKPTDTSPKISVSDDGIANTGSMTATATNGGMATNVVGNNNNLGVPAILVEKIITVLSQRLSPGAQANDTEIKALTKAVTALSEGQGVIGTDEQIKVALDTLAQGNPAQAKTLFAKTTQKGEQGAKQKAEAYRNLGALAYLDNTQEALAAYRRATELDPNNTDGWNNLGHLLRRLGDLDGAITAYGKVLTLGEAHNDIGEVAASYNNLGLIHETRGELDKALEYHQRSLVLDEGLGDKEGMALSFGNLGTVYQILGELDKAVEYQQKALVLNEGLRNKEGMALNYGNLGIVYKTRSELDKAVEYQQKALVLNEGLKNKEGMARDYCNLGNVYLIRDELDKAMEYYQKSLSHFEDLGDKKNLALTFGNIGVIYSKQSNFGKSEEYYQKALKLNESLGYKEGMALNYSGLGIVHFTLGELDKAVEYQQKALLLDEGLQNKEGIAREYGNLGGIYKQQGHKDQAKQAYQKSIDLFKTLDNPTLVKQVQGLLDAL